MRRHSILFASVLALVIVASLATSSFSAVSDERLNEGLVSSEPYSYVLLQNASAHGADNKEILMEAVKYSPDVPAYYFELARASLPSMEAFGYAVEGAKAYKRSFWWMQSIQGLLLFSLFVSFAVSMLVVALLRLAKSLYFLCHNISHDKILLVLPLLILFVSFLGPLFLTAGLLVVVGLYLNRTHKAVVYVYLVFLIVSPYLVKQLNIYLYSSTPLVRSVVAVNEGNDNKLAIGILNGMDGFAERFSYGLALKREGRFDDAITLHLSLLDSYKDPRVYNNLGTVYTGRGLSNKDRTNVDMSLAKESFGKSIDIKPYVQTLYNMSKVSMETLDYKSGDEYSAKALALNRDSATKLASASTRNHNRFVVDIPLEPFELRQFASRAVMQRLKVYPVSDSTASGVAFALMIIFAVFDSMMKNRASACNRCGKIYCSKCSKKETHPNTCQECFAAISNPRSESAQDRVAKILAVQAAKSSSRMIVTAIAFIMPGAGHIYIGKTFTGFLFLWIFLLSVFICVFNPLVGTGLSLQSHSWLRYPIPLLAGLVYLASVGDMIRRIRLGWL